MPEIQKFEINNADDLERYAGLTEPGNNIFIVKSNLSKIQGKHYTWSMS